MAYYRPRIKCRIYVPIIGSASERAAQAESTEVIPIDLNVSAATFESNDHNAADSIELETNWNEAGSDPRLLTNAEVYVWMGDGGVSGDLPTNQDTLRFVGIVVDSQRALGPDSKTVRIRAHDYTTLFLKSKPFPDAGVPDYTQSLAEAWKRICDHTGAWDFISGKIVSTVQALANKIKFVNVDQGTVLGKAVSARFAKFGKVQCRPSDDAWAVWCRCVGSLGLITFVLRDQVIVTTATDYYTADDPPRLLWGENITKLEETRDVNALSGKGVALTSFDPLTGTTIEAFYPPDGDTAKGRKKRVVASASQTPKAVTVKDYEFFSYPGVTDPDMLAVCCRRAFEERSRQELLGTLQTSEMSVDTVGGQAFDLLSLNAGGRIRIELKEDIVNDITRVAGVDRRVAFLKDRGYADGVALLMAKNIDALGRLSSEFQVRNMRAHIDVDKDGGSSTYDIQFINRIEISGDALGATK